MELFKHKTKIASYENFISFAKDFMINKNDLIITSKSLYKSYMQKTALSCHYIIKNNYGAGEPSDLIIDSILTDIKTINYDRIIAIGGGSIIDIAKFISIDGLNSTIDIFDNKIKINRSKPLIAIPTTCGSGSEVTNVAITEITTRKTKLGFANDAIIPDIAVFIPTLLKNLSYKAYICSAIDALIHATESFVSPRANTYTKMFSSEAIKIIITILKKLIEEGQDYRFQCFDKMLLAANLAGIAFANAGVGAVHAMSYPIGAKYHIPHGESNYLFFTDVFKIYNKKNPNGAIKELNNLYKILLNTEDNVPFQALDNLLSNLLEKNRLSSYGMEEAEIVLFANSVTEKQQRLLKNNYIELSIEEIATIYKQLF